jgi:SAM-dependent methyltransferase
MAIVSALAAYEAALRVGSGITVQTRAGRPISVPVEQWLDDPSHCDHQILALCPGDTLEVGCGPGRLTRALTDRHQHAIGIDVSAAAVQIAITRGAAAVHGDVFDEVPREGTWDHVLLADGNIGISGDPARLLARCRDVTHPGGTIVAEVEPPGGRSAQGHVRVTAHGHTGWLPWAWVSADTVAELAAQAGLTVRRTLVTISGRHAVELVPSTAAGAA